MDKPKKKRQYKIRTRRTRCRLCKELCEPNKLLWNREFREKLQDIACIWIKIWPGSWKYHVCDSCKNEVEVYYSFKKRCRQLLHGGNPLPQETSEESDLQLNALLENCKDEVDLPQDALESLASTSLNVTNSPAKDDNSVNSDESDGSTEELPKPKRRTQVHGEATQKAAVSAPVQTLASDETQPPEHNDGELQSDQPTKKLRPERRKFNKIAEEQSMTEDEYRRYYRRAHHNGSKKICDICGKSIIAQRMDSHMNRHKGVEPYSCEECGLQFHCRANLRKHITRSHVKGQEVTCTICNKVSVSAIALKQHIRAVHSEKKFQCTLCHVKTVSQFAMDRHMDIHNQRRDFVCPHCGKAFYRRYVLNIHLRTHSGETPYKCHVCAEAFVHRRIYVMHMKKLHPAEPLMQVDRVRALKEVLMQKDFG